MWFGHCIWWYYGGCLHTRINIFGGLGRHMELEIKYGVFLKDKDNPEEWRIFAGWFSKYEDAYAVYNDLKSKFE